MIIHRPTRMHTIAIGVVLIAAGIALSAGSTVMVGANVAVLAGLAQSYSWSRRHPAAEVGPHGVRLHGRSLEVHFSAGEIEGWQREGKALRIVIAGGGDARLGPFWVSGPSRELESALEQTFPDRAGGL